MSDSSSNDSFTLTLDDVEVQAHPGETLWQVAKRAGETIPHLCFKDAPGYRSDGNCRACMVEVAEGLSVNPNRMRQNLELTGGAVYSERTSLGIAEEDDPAYLGSAELFRRRLLDRED